MTTSTHTRTLDRDKPRVCMLVRNDLMNDPRVTRHAEALGTHGFKVIVVCTASERTPTKEIRSDYEVLRVGTGISLIMERLAQRTKRRSALRTIVRLVQIFTLQLTLLRAARRIPTHVYCANDLDTLLIGVLASGLDRKLVYDSHELWPDMLATIPEFARRMLRVYEGLLIRRTDLVMTVNELIGQVLQSRYSVAKPIEIVYNCPPARAGLQKRKDSKRGRLKTALYQGRYVPQRGLENLVRAAEFLLPDVELLFRGYGPIEGQLKMLASGSKNIRFAQPVAMRELIDAARTADVGIVSYIPSNLNNYLASPNKLFEYINAGLPVAASDIPFLRRTICDNEIGVVFDPKDPHSIARSLNQITRTKELRRLGKMVVAAALKYNWQTEEKKLLHAYARLLHGFK